MLRTLPYTAAALAFATAALFVADTRPVRAQAAPAAPVPAAPAVAPAAGPPTTLLQIDGTSFVIGMGALGSALAAGIRSAAGVVTKYMGEQAEKAAGRDAAWADAFKTLAGIVARHEANSTTTAEALEDLTEEMDELAGAVAELAGKPKTRTRAPRKARRPAPPPADPDDTATASKI